MIGDVTWDTPSPTSAGSLPLGNGELAANVWVEPAGDLVFYLAKSDAWDHLCRLLKLGRLRVRLDPPLLPAGTRFATQLDLATASILVTAQSPDRTVTLRVWVDAHRPRLVVQVDSTAPVAIEASLDPWRTAARPLTGAETGSAYGVCAGPDPLVAQPDTVVDAPDAGVLWYHRNATSIWGPTLDHQSLGAFKSAASDPLLHRTFGGILSGAGFGVSDPYTLRRPQPVTTAMLAVDVLTAQTATADEWVATLRALAASHARITVAEAWRDHTDHWRDFWARSHIVVTAREPDWGNADDLTAAYARQRYLAACSSRGAFPIKFNGGLFTADWGNQDGQAYDADYRRWGGAYWFQNTRLPYWAMLAAGDTDLLAPLVRMYREMLPLAEFRNLRWFGHGGAFFPETAYFWGSHLNDNYGWKRDGLPPGEVVNRYIGRDYNGALELLALMLATHAQTHDRALLEHDILPMARATLQFFAEHFPREPDGTLRLAPAQALETWWDCVNPTPDVAGLRHVLTTLLSLPGESLTATDRVEWSTLAALVPALPLVQRDGQTCVAPAAQHELAPHNLENAELYAVFPFPIYSVGRPDLAIGRSTFLHRPFQDTGGWRQDAVHAAWLGLTEAAVYYVLKNVAAPSPARFRGFYGPNYDWLPDFDHASVTQLALQSMLLQCVGERIYLFPAWPTDRWDVSFRLHTSGQTIVEAELKAGQLVRFDVTPASRRRDVVILLGQDKTLAASLPALSHA